LLDEPGNLAIGELHRGTRGRGQGTALLRHSTGACGARPRAPGVLFTPSFCARGDRMDVTLRPIGPDEFDAFRTVTGFALAFEPRGGDGAVLRPYFESDGTVAALTGGRIVGTLGTFSLPVTVPGGAALPMAGTTFVGVLPTHRRRGLLRRMVAAHFADIRS